MRGSVQERPRTVMFPRPALGATVQCSPLSFETVPRTQSARLVQVPGDGCVFFEAAAGSGRQCCSTNSLALSGRLNREQSARVSGRIWCRSSCSVVYCLVVVSPLVDAEAAG